MRSFMCNEVVGEGRRKSRGGCIEAHMSWVSGNRGLIL